jgi:hypothetical protein
MGNVPRPAAAAAALLLQLPSSGRWAAIVPYIMFAQHSILVALYSHFGPGKFPATWHTVLYCVIIYVGLNAVLMIFSHIKEGDSFLTTHPKAVSG